MSVIVFDWRTLYSIFDGWESETKHIPLHLLLGILCMYLTYETMNVLRGIRAYYSILLLLRHFFTEELVNQYYL